MLELHARIDDDDREPVRAKINTLVNGHGELLTSLCERS